VITAIIVVSAVVAAVTAFVARPFARAVTLRVVGAIERAA
jgi:hypothetical protein